MNNQTTAICVYGQKYIFHYQYEIGKHKIKLENMRLISLTTSNLFSFGKPIQCIFITDISTCHLSLQTLWIVLLCSW